MKHVLYYLTFLSVIFMGGGFTSCKSDPTPDDPQGGEPSAQLAIGEIGTNSVELKLTTQNIVEYAYMVTSKMTDSAPSAAVLFGQGTPGTPADGLNTIKLVDLEGNTAYKVFVATRSNKGYGEVMTTDKITTKKYTDFVTPIELDDHFSVKFHIEVPAGKTIAWAVIDRERYIAFKEDPNLSFTDADLLMMMADDESQRLTESKTIHFESWLDEDPDTGEMVETNPAPGQALALLVAEVEFGVNAWGQEGWMPLFDFDKYYGNSGGGMDPLAPATRQGDAPVEDECWTTDYHAVAYLDAKPPVVLDAKVNVKVLTHTTRTLSVELTQDAKMDMIGYICLERSAWDETVRVVGSESAAVTYWMLGGMKTSSDKTVVCTVEALELGKDYRLIIIGRGNSNGTLQSTQYYDFKAAEPTKAAPKVLVTAIKAPAGYTESPWMVWFNIKATSKDVVKAKYACDDTGTWVKTLNTGSTYTSIIDRNGMPIAEEHIAAINSDAGYNMSFSSWEDSQTRLAVMCYNDEEYANSPDKDKNGWADNRTIMREPLTPVSSTLYEDLAGDWTATAKLYQFKNNAWVLNETPVVKKVTLAAKPEELAATTPDKAYTVYKNKTREEVDALYADLLKSADKYAGKIKGMNSLIGLGLDYANSFTRFESPLSLFLSPYYDCYTTDDIYHDYGPKWQLQVSAGDKLSIPVDLTNIPPLQSYGDYPIYFIGSSDDDYAADLKKFDVELSADKQTLTVTPAVLNGKTYYPTIGRVFSGQMSISARMHSLVLTKGWGGKSLTAPVPTTNAPALKSSNPSMKISVPSRKTRLEAALPVDLSKAVIIQPVSTEKAREADYKMAAKYKRR